MRVLTLVLLMLLLPLRAWAGDAMALSELRGHGPATVQVSAAADQHAGHDHSAGHVAPVAAADADQDCPSHVACDVCNGPVLSLPVWQAHGATVVHRPRVPSATDFASLVPQRHHKPPIA